MTIFWVYRHADESLQKKIRQLWVDNELLDDTERQRRLNETAIVVLNRDNIVVGVSTIFSAQLHPNGDYYWFYRSFIEDNEGQEDLSSRVFEYARKVLTEDNQGEAEPNAGIVVLASDDKLKSDAGRRKLERLGLVSKGVGPRGREIWMLKFQHQA